MQPFAERVADLVDRVLQRALRRVATANPGSSLLGGARRRAHYRTGRRFTAAIERWQEPNRGHPMFEVWLDYGLGTNLRGAAVVEMLARHKGVRGARALDVGCAYGGVSIAFAAAGAEGVGIDLDPNLLALAAHNVADRRAAVRLARVDITDTPRVLELGCFDFVTCSDVIEHVADVPLTLANLAAALRPGGLLHLQIPNGFSAGLVLRDGHFGLFGITLLERPDALRYFAESGFAAGYDVGSYLPLADYVAILDGHGIRSIAAAPGSAAECDAAVAAVRERAAAIERAAAALADDARLSSETRSAVARGVAAWLGEVRTALAELDAEVDAARRAVRVLDFVSRFATERWDLIARRPG